MGMLQEEQLWRDNAAFRNTIKVLQAEKVIALRERDEAVALLKEVLAEHRDPVSQKHISTPLAFRIHQLTEASHE